MTVRSKALYQHIQYIVDSANRRTHVILPIEVFERIKCLLEEEDFSIRETYPAQEQVAAEDWMSPEIQATIENLRKVKYAPDYMLPCGMTIAEYDALSDEEEERMWDEAFKKELDKEERYGIEVDVRPNALPAGQKRPPSVRKGAKKKANRARANR